MAKMRAVDAAMYVLEKEGITTAFGVPGAAINPFYSAMRKHGGIRHILARHVEGASHMAEGYTRAMAGNIGVCLGTSGPAGTDMITALYSASADSIPILCITGQAPRARLHKEDFQAVDIEAIAKPVSKMAVTVREAALVPRVLQQAFHLVLVVRVRYWWIYRSTFRLRKSSLILTCTNRCRFTNQQPAVCRSKKLLKCFSRLNVR